MGRGKWGVPRRPLRIPRRAIDVPSARPAFHLREANIVATFTVAPSLDLDALSANVRETLKLCCNRMSATMRMACPNATALLFKSGKALVIGGKYTEHAQFAAAQCARILRECGVENAAATNFRVRNIASSMRIPCAIDVFKLDRLTEVKLVLGQFPGAVIKFDMRGQRSITCFTSGCCNITGAVSTEETVAAFMQRIEFIRQCAVFGADVARLERDIVRRRKAGF